MTNEKQVVSQKLSQKLKELGVKQESLFWWIDDEHLNELSYKTPIGFVLQNGSEISNHIIDREMPKIYSAFTVAELGEMFNDIGADLFIKAYGEVFNFKGTGSVGLLGVINLMRKPDMGAKMLIYLIENKLITLG